MPPIPIDDDFIISAGEVEDFPLLLVEDNIEEFSVDIEFTDFIYLINLPGNENEIVVIGPSGNIQSSGILITDIGGGSSEVTLIAGAILNGQALVMWDGSGLFIFDPTDGTQYLKLVGFTKTSCLLGENVKVVTAGAITQVGWGLTPGDLYYATTAGQITNIVPSHTILQPVGTAQDANTLIINLSQPILTT